MKFTRTFCVLSSRTITFLHQQNAMTKGNLLCKVPKRGIKISPATATCFTSTTAFSQNQRNASSSSSAASDDNKTVERKFQPNDIIDKLNDNERESLRQALEHLNLDLLKHKLEGKIKLIFNISGTLLSIRNN